MPPPHTTAQTQSGIMLLEAMIAILIFSLGVLALVALQGTSIKLTDDAKHRTNATMLANRLIGQMWASNGDLAALKTNFEPPAGAAYIAWLAEIASPDGLPGVVATVAGVDPTVPLVSVDAGGKITITLFWRPPGMPLTGEPSANSCLVSRHCLTVVSQISR